MLTAEQKQARLGKVTSSVAAGALGLHPHMTPLQAWLAVKGELPEPEDMKAIERGNRLEQITLQSIAEDLGLQLSKAEFRSIAPWAGDSADAVYTDQHDRVVAIGEGKSAAMSAARHYGEEDTDEVPESALVQSHWHLIHWPEVNVCWVPVLVGGYRFEFRRYRVDRDPELEGILQQDLERWHRDYVVADRPPPLLAGDDDWAKQRFPLATGGMVAATPEIAELARSYHAAHESLKVIEANKTAAGARLRMLLAESEGCKADWGSVTYRNNKGSTKVDWAGLVEELRPPQELIEKYTYTAPGPRVLRVNVRE